MWARASVSRIQLLSRQPALSASAARRGGASEERRADEARHDDRDAQREHAERKGAALVTCLYLLSPATASRYAAAWTMSRGAGAGFGRMGVLLQRASPQSPEQWYWGTERAVGRSAPLIIPAEGLHRTERSGGRRERGERR